MKKILLTIIIIIHRIIVYTMMFGFLLPNNYLYIHILLWPIVYIHWFFNNDTCILTELEYKLKNIDYKYIPKSKDDHDYPYMKKILNDFNIKMTNKQIHKYILKYLTLVWIFSVIRYIIYKKSNNK